MMVHTFVVYDLLLLLLDSYEHEASQFISSCKVRNELIYPVRLFFCGLDECLCCASLIQEGRRQDVDAAKDATDIYTSQQPGRIVADWKWRNQTIHRHNPDCFGILIPPSASKGGY